MKTSTTRRTILAGLAAAPVAGLPAIAAALPSADPVLAAIERHKAAAAEFATTCNMTDEVAAETEGREVTDEDIAAWETANDGERDALATLTVTAPTTVSGARAALEYIRGVNWQGKELSAFAATLLSAPILL